ncbi:MAG: sigma factor-like helix-turn-helix DNA-binding protein [Actinomycetes bacterium]
MAVKTLSELIASLPEEERAILTLHYLKSQTSLEIAELLQVPERAVVSVISSAKNRLLTALLGEE